MDELNRDIEKYEKIKKNSNRFIKYKNIKKYKYIGLPNEIFFGTTYLIKNNNIIEIYSYIEYEFSLDIRRKQTDDTWISRINLINIEPTDPDQLKYIFNNATTIFNTETLEATVLDLIDSGFKIYLL